MDKPITVIMPFLNEGNEPIETLRSLFNTAPESLFSVIAIDDCSEQEPGDEWREFIGKDLKLLRNEQRIGVDASRHTGMMECTTPFALIIDAHMRFTDDDWMERYLLHLERNPQTVFCTTSIGLGYGVTRMEDSTVRYQGATFHLVSPEPVCAKGTGELKVCREIIEGKWLDREVWPDVPCYDVACVMGANYGMSKEWYDHLHGLVGLQAWGTSEPLLSIKSYLAGGDCKCIADIEIGHVYRDNSPFGVHVFCLMFNKLFLMRVLLPESSWQPLESFMSQDGNLMYARNLIEQMSGIWKAERAHAESIRKVSIEDYFARFAVPTEGIL